MYKIYHLIVGVDPFSRNVVYSFLYTQMGVNVRINTNNFSHFPTMEVTLREHKINFIKIIFWYIVLHKDIRNTSKNSFTSQLFEPQLK